MVDGSVRVVAYAAVALVATLVCLLVTPAIGGLARRLSLVDAPRGRHGHAREVPLLGGVAIAIGFASTLWLANLFDPVLLQPLLDRHGDGLWWLAISAALVLGLGAVDDVFEVSAPAKLAVQSIAASIVVIAGYGFVSITNPFTGGYIALGVLGPLVTLVWIVVITNAFNLIDGLDGLAAGVALIASLTLIGIALLEGRADAVLVWAVLGGCLLGFLPYNFPPASIFLGDSGSLLLGFAMAVLSIQSLQKGATTVVLAVPVLALGLPISDAAYAVMRRWLVSGVAAIMRADREHIHHRLVRTGISDRTALLVLYASCLVFSGLAFMAVVARGPLEAVLVALAAIATFAATRLLDQRVRRREAADGRRTGQP